MFVRTNFYSTFILYFNPNYINYDFTANFKRNCCQNHSVLCFIIAIVFSLKVYDLVMKSFELKTATAMLFHLQILLPFCQQTYHRWVNLKQRKSTKAILNETPNAKTDLINYQ
jgi:hypothetical protein